MQEILTKKKYTEPEVEVLFKVEGDILFGSFENGDGDTYWSEWVE